MEVAQNFLESGTWMVISFTPTGKSASAEKHGDITASPVN